MQNPGCSSWGSNFPEKEDVMRIKDDFTVFPREMASGKVIFYYQADDEDGRGREM
jgi:hypothetical protein